MRLENVRLASINWLINGLYGFFWIYIKNSKDVQNTLLVNSK